MLSLLNEYNIEEQPISVLPFGSGLINNTWVVKSGISNKYIFQKINENVFKEPESISANIDCIAEYIKSNHPDYLFASPVLTKDQKTYLHDKQEGYFRMFPFIKDSHSVDVVQTASQAYEAASQFGKFTRILNEFDVTKLKVTIPDFHNLTLRYSQFRSALKNGNPERLQSAANLINELLQLTFIVTEYEKICENKDFKKRVTHHDTKISNVLFGENNKGLCVIDLDTVMPGYFISDLGDMIRTYLSPVSEEEKDYSKIEIRDDFYTAVVTGYYNEMKDVLSETEKQYFFYSGVFMIYMQSIRFLTDYLNNDMYYGEKYPGHNFVRAGNQVVLLKRLLEKKQLLLNRTVLK